MHNLRKWLEFIKQIIDRLSNHEWLALTELTTKELISKLLSSKPYIDFGNNPGKDRIPRKATICGCCVIAGLRGAASNNADIPIHNKYKFEVKVNSLDNIAFA
ncbi:MAG: hypothetical protein HUJ51_05465 [Eggerthellaceae bacterium]|nr:hypothetical protein [Eggerthellaceae bacterium]